MSVRCRRLRADDYDRGFAALVGSELKLEQFARYFYGVCATESHIYVLEEDRGSEGKTLLAAGTLFIEEKTTHNVCKLAHLENVFVGEAFRGKGFGKLLVKFLREEARTLGCYRMNCTSTADLAPFYRAFGFRRPQAVLRKIFNQNFTVSRETFFDKPRSNVDVNFKVPSSEEHVPDIFCIRNLCADDYINGFPELIRSRISADIFNAYLKEICCSNHIVLVMENEIGKLLGTVTLLVERKYTHGLCKMAHIENLHLDSSCSQAATDSSRKGIYLWLTAIMLSG